MSERPNVDLDKPRYDQSTYFGRVKHFINVVDPRVLLTTDTKLNNARELLRKYKDGEDLGGASEEDLWQAKKVVDTVVHPDTGEKIFLPFRISAFAPANVLICWGLLLPNPTYTSTIFWQWVNQSYNLGVNHANRNASNTMSNAQIAGAYTGAVTVSVAVALGLSEVVKRADKFSPAIRGAITRFIPFTAVASAGVANVFLMRRIEMVEGIEIKDADGNEVGKSPKAGFRAISQVAAVRVATALPCLTVPPVIMGLLEKTSFMRNNPRAQVPVHLAVITTSLFTALPLTIAMFPQTVATPAKSLEPEFHNLRDIDGNPIETVYYNRGL